jgi:hypothetical protein
MSGARNKPAADGRGLNFRIPAPLFLVGVTFKKEEGVDASFFSKAAKAAPNLDETPLSRFDMVKTNVHR